MTRSGERDFRSVRLGAAGGNAPSGTTRADRLADGGPETIAEWIGRSPRRGWYRIAVRNRKGEGSEAVLEIRYRSMRIQTSQGKKKRYSELMATVIEARGQETAPDREPDRLETDHRPGGGMVQWYALHAR